MSVFITLTPENFADSVEQTAEIIDKGEIAVVAAEHGYLYVANAFDHEAVRNIHIVRGDPAFTATQVIVGSGDVLQGLATDYDDELKLIAENFWPGLLSVHVMPHYSLNWDLGDGGELSEFVVRVPSQDFLRELALKTGPLAAASAAIAGRPPTQEIQFVPALDTSIGIYIDQGVLPEGPASTVIRRKVLGVTGGLEVLREGAISLEKLQEIVPAMTAHVPQEPPVN